MRLPAFHYAARNTSCNTFIYIMLYPLYRRLGGHQSRRGQVRKISPPLGFNPWTVQSVPGHYTDWATSPTHHNGDCSLNSTSRSFFRLDLSASNFCAVHLSEQAFVSCTDKVGSLLVCAIKRRSTLCVRQLKREGKQTCQTANCTHYVNRRVYSCVNDRKTQCG